MEAFNLRKGDKNFLGKTVYDLIRQILALIPLLALFVLSRNDFYLSFAVINSAITLSAAFVLVGLNFLVVLENRSKYIHDAIGYSVTLTPLVCLLVLVILSFSKVTNSVPLEVLVTLVLAEALFAFPLQMVSKFALAEFNKKSLFILNIVSPLCRAATLVLLLIREIQLFVVSGYLLVQITCLFLAIRKTKTYINLNFHRNKMFVKELRDGLPNWLSGLGITAIDNVAVLMVAFTFPPEVSTLVILMVRILSVSTLPMHSIAQANLSIGLRDFKAEARIIFSTALLTALISLFFVSAVVAILLQSRFEIVQDIWILLSFPVLRTLSTFMGNYLVRIGWAWTRVFASVVGLTGTVAFFLIIWFASALEIRNFFLGSLPLVIGEMSVVMVLALALMYSRGASKQKRKAGSDPNASH